MTASRGARAGTFLAALVIALGIAGWVRLSPLEANDLVGGDEGYYATMARNMLADVRYVISPSQSPLGAPGDKPPLYPGILALSIRVLGPTELAVRWPSLLAAAVTAFAASVLVARAAAPWAGALAAFLLMTLPWFADVSRIVAGEIPLTALGAAALAIATGGTPSIRRAALSGLLLGLAFLCKLWLIALIAAPVAIALLPRDSRGGWALGALIVSFAAAASLHLGVVAAWDPASLPHWRDVYLRRSLAERVAGEGYASYWIQPPLYYWSMLSHAFALMLPLVAVGLESAVRRFREPIPRALAVWGLGVVLLSAFTVKMGNYAYPVVPAWAALAALGAHALISGRSGSVAWPAIVMVASYPGLAAGNAPRVPLPLWLAVWSAFFAMLAITRWRRASRGVLAGAFALATCAGGFLRETERLPIRYHAPGYPEVAATLRSRLEDAPPRQACFVGPEVPALGFYLFRTGLYWRTPGTAFTRGRAARLQADTSLRAFVVDTTRGLYGGWPDSTQLAWLIRETDEITSEIADRVRRRTGRETPLRLFVRRGRQGPEGAPGVSSRTR